MVNILKYRRAIMAYREQVTITWASEADSTNADVLTALTSELTAKTAANKTDGIITNVSSTVMQTKWVDRDSAEAFVFYIDDIRKLHSITPASVDITGIVVNDYYANQAWYTTNIKNKS